MTVRLRLTQLGVHGPTNTVRKLSDGRTYVYTTTAGAYAPVVQWRLRGTRVQAVLASGRVLDLTPLDTVYLDKPQGPRRRTAALVAQYKAGLR
jgi:hypothetical protein